MSPSHQVSQCDPSSLDATVAPAYRLATPTVALTSVLSIAANTTSETMSRTRASDGRKPARASSHAPIRGSSVLPAAIAATVRAGAPVPAFASSAPSATAGHMRGPHTTIAARAIPDGAQIAVTFALSFASARPPSAVAQ